MGHLRAPLRASSALRLRARGRLRTPLSRPALSGEVPAYPRRSMLVVAGVPGAGKTTLARALAQRLMRSACIEGDLVQHHFTINGLVAPGESPADEAERQLEVRWDNCACLARNFWRAGFDVVVEHAAARRSWIDRFAAALPGVPLSVIVLAPPLSVALERDRSRQEKQVAHLFAHMDAEMRKDLAGVGWWLDTGDLSVAQSVEQILGGGLAAGRLPVER